MNNYLDEIMRGLNADEYGLDELYSWFDQRAGRQQAPQRTTLLDYIRGEMYANPVRNSLPRPGGSPGINAVTQPVPQAPSMTQAEAGRQYVDKTNLAPAPVASPASQSQTFNGTPENIQKFKNIAGEYGAVVGGDGGLNMSSAAYAQLLADPRLTVNSQVAAPVSAPKPAAATPKPAAATPKPATTGIGLGSTAATKPTTSAAKPTQSSGFNMTVQKPVTSSTKPKTSSTGIKF